MTHPLHGILFLILLISSAGELRAQTEVHNEWPNGESREQGHLIEGLPDGEWKYFSDSGHLVKRVLFELGTDTASWEYERRDDGSIYSETFHRSGRLDWKKTYVLDTIRIEYQEFDQSENLRVTGILSEGEKDKSWEYFYANGLKSKSLNYEKGAMHGRQEYYSESGILSLVLHLELGVRSGEQKQYDSTGTLLSSSTYKNGEILKRKTLVSDIPGKKTWKKEEFILNTEIEHEAFEQDTLGPHFSILEKSRKFIPCQLYKDGNLEGGYILWLSPNRILFADSNKLLTDYNARDVYGFSVNGIEYKSIKTPKGLIMNYFEFYEVIDPDWHFPVYAQTRDEYYNIGGGPVSMITKAAVLDPEESLFKKFLIEVNSKLEEVLILKQHKLKFKSRMSKNKLSELFVDCPNVQEMLLDSKNGYSAKDFLKLKDLCPVSNRH